MSAPELHALLSADARRWPDHRDYWRFGPVLDVCTLPPTLPSEHALWATLYTAGRKWVTV